MPEYLSPGVYVEETSFRSKSIEGVSTSTAGFVGPTRYGPVSGLPELITSLADFERIYGGLDDLTFGGNPQPNYLAHAVRAFFEEGGERLYVSRIFNFGSTNPIDSYYAFFSPSDLVTIKARFPGAAGSMGVSFTLRVGPNILSWSGLPNARIPGLSRLQEYTLVYVRRLTTATDATKAADQLAAGTEKDVATLIAAATKTPSYSSPTVFQGAKSAANDLKAAVDAVVKAITTASTTTPQSVAAATQKKADEFTTESAKTAADLVAKAAKHEADKGRITTVQTVQDVTTRTATALANTIEAILNAVNASTETDPKKVAEAGQTEANKYTSDPAKTVAGLVAKAAKDAADKSGATVQSVRDDTKTAADAIESAVQAVADYAKTHPEPSVSAIAAAAQQAASKFTDDPAKTAAGAVAQVAATAAAQANASIESVSKEVNKDATARKAAADKFTNVVLTPWLPVDSDVKASLYIAQQVPDPGGPYWELNGKKLDTLNLTEGTTEIRPITVVVEIARQIVDAQGIPRYSAPESLGEFNFDPRSASGLTGAFTRAPATRFEALTTPFAVETTLDFTSPDNDKTIAFASELMNQAFSGLNGASFSADTLRVSYILASKNPGDGEEPDLAAYEGHPDFTDITGDKLQMPKNGLLAFEAIEDISIVAAPGYSALSTDDERLAVHRAIIDHCEKMRYRVAVLDTPQHQLVSGALNFRNLTSSNYAALYYPWITILDPATDQRLNLPPSGFVAGIYARNDTEHAVFKAPANEVVRLAIDFEQRINKAQQDVLNPEGVNCFRYFPGHGFLLWGARTISTDPDWKYISVRRYFAYLEHSIDRGTQWVVFENNGPQLWDNVRRTIEDFLLNEWKMGALLGDKPEQAYFVRCDRSTMTQNDLDNGRLVCLIGVAVVKPAEFVIFRIGQLTAKTNN